MTKRPPRLDSWCARCSWCAFASFAFLVGTTKAADITATWDGGSGNWSDASHWMLDPLGAPVVPNNTSTTFDVVINAGTVRQDFVAGVEIVNLHLSGGTLTGSGPVTVTGRDSNWSGGGIDGLLNVATDARALVSGSATKRIGEATLNIAGTVTWTDTGNLSANANASTINILEDGLFESQNNQLLTFTSGATHTINNAGTFRKSVGIGTTSVLWIVNNSLGGLIDVQTGTLRIRSGTSTGGAFSTSAGATLNIENNYTFDTATIVNNFGTLSVSDEATLTVDDATINNAGAIDIVRGTLKTNVDRNLGGVININGGTSYLGGDGIATLTGTVNWIAGGFTGSGDTVIAPGAHLNISGSSDKGYSNHTVVNQGTATWTGEGDLRVYGTGLTSIFNNEGLFDVQNDRWMHFSSGGGHTFNNSGTFRKSGGDGSTTMRWIFNNSGTVEVQSGELSTNFLGASDGGTFSISEGATLEFSWETYTLDDATVISNAGTLSLGAESAKLTVGMATINNTGGIDIKTGHLDTNVDRSLNGVITLHDRGSLGGTGIATLTGTVNWTGGSFTGSGDTVIAPGAALNLLGGDNKSYTNHTVVNQGTTTWTGNGDLIASSAFQSGHISVFNNEGLFDAQNDREMRFSSGSGHTFNNSGTFRKSNSTGTTFVSWAFNNTGTVEVQAGTLSITGAFNQTDSSARILLDGGAFSKSGTLSINAGSIEGNGTIISTNVQTHGAISPGQSAGTLAFSGNLSLLEDSQTTIELGGLASGTEHDQVNVTGALALGGTLAVSLIDAGLGQFAPALGDSFDILNWGSANGTFDAIVLPELGAGLMWNAGQLYSAGVLSIALAGDYNDNGVVDAADYTVWRDTLGSTTNLAANGNGNDQIDAEDYTVWKTNFGDTSGSGSGANLAVPEPKAWAMALLVLTGLIWRRSR